MGGPLVGARLYYGTITYCGSSMVIHWKIRATINGPKSTLPPVIPWPEIATLYNSLSIPLYIPRSERQPVLNPDDRCFVLTRFAAGVLGTSTLAARQLLTHPDLSGISMGINRRAWCTKIIPRHFLRPDFEILICQVVSPLNMIHFMSRWTAAR